MAASEKLKALEDEAGWEGGQGGGHRATQAIADALPQIVAVVEAAEDELRSEDCAKTVAALAALDEALK